MNGFNARRRQLDTTKTTTASV